MKYIDVHSHPHFADFDADREEMFARMRENGVGTIAVGTDLETSRRVVELAQSGASDVVLGATVGVHPTEREEFRAEDYKELLDSGVVRAVGECGLDYFRTDGALDSAERERQRALFISQIEFAIEHKLPLMLHIRSSAGSTDAHDDAYEILAPYKRAHTELHLHMHFFTMDFSVAERFIELDATFGIPGVLTFASSVRKMVKLLPRERIVLESDAPYAAPVPHRGERNESTFITDTLHKLAELRNEDMQDLAETILDTSRRVFGLR